MRNLVYLWNFIFVRGIQNLDPVLQILPNFQSPNIICNFAKAKISLLPYGNHSGSLYIADNWIGPRHPKILGNIWYWDTLENIKGNRVSWNVINSTFTCPLNQAIKLIVLWYFFVIPVQFFLNNLFLSYPCKI